MGHSSRNMDTVVLNVIWWTDQEVSEEKNVSVLPRDWSYDILVKKVAAFCPCPRSLPESKVKSFGIILLAEEISKQPSRDSEVWLLVVILLKICNKKEQAEQGKLQKVNFEKQKSTRKWNGAKSCVQGDKGI